MRPEYRNKKIEAYIRELIAQAIQKIKEPEFEYLKDYIVISRVLISKDRRFADVFVSVIGNSEQRKKAVELLEKYKGYFRTFVAKNVRLYTAPELRFKEDKGIEESVRINKLLDEIMSKEDENGSDN
ncbi:ribosome-binding factor A [Thermosipho africanus Ob7]|jgi:ribosome-binding factor A|uniref:Ribosome-binding factor A n=1 Tax=Thermosipho africanus (strain TCF52B) TaxID=484019 RepID=RBFA_THEAB|nr:30S ribosome-binding factor RbfA [Thermosipho africanus]B7IDY7.1 RecName: Full=Ribosome-binding factor A [Thermosipho africanus TCF52B]MDK2838765.1 ribosome-binding factor [Thermosipho sp. (in: thermotogales)]ACJ76214.1 ribosome-binding factor A [Thermosipho africanus TCF52B]MDK2900619.1 ribosome-binding factor [Thermosipho sp. (in: thermotogales)]RDI92019.1 ribosome-binding factor A [Thermosipho africanus Ob7]